MWISHISLFSFLSRIYKCLSLQPWLRPKLFLGSLFFFVKKQWIKFLFILILWLAWPIDQTIFPLLFGKIIDNFSTYSGPRDVAWGVLQGPILGALALWIGVEARLL